MDESLVLPLIASGILEFFSGSDEGKGNSSFSAEDAIEEYKDWYNQQEFITSIMAVARKCSNRIVIEHTP